MLNNNQIDRFKTPLNRVPPLGLTTQKEQALDLLEGLRRQEEVKEEPQGRFMMKEGKGEAIRCPEDVAKIFRAILNAEDVIERDKEHFWCVIVDAKNIIKSIELISLGSLTAAIVHPRELYRRAVTYGAGSILIGHNHPSGDPTPSKEDIELTKKLQEAGDILGIKLLDHIVIGKDYHVSLREMGYMV